MTILEDKEVFKRFDKDDMKGLIDAFPKQLKDAKEIAERAEIRLKKRDYKGIATIGMGGSMIGGALMERMMRKKSDIPFLSFRGYHIPDYIDDNWLIFAISYSGNTIETLSALKEVLNAGCDIIVITSGGILGEIAEKRDLTWVKIPAGRPPRASLGYLFIPIGVMCERLGLYEGFCDEVDASIDKTSGLYEKYRFKVNSEENPAKMLARDMEGKLPVIYGSEGILEVCAERWAGQLQENAKLLAYYISFPELCHNQSIGWEDSSGFAKKLIVLSLEGEWEEGAILEQRNALFEIVESKGGVVRRGIFGGDGGLVSALMNLYLADYVSLYLAMLNGVDPTAIGSIDLIKERTEGFKEEIVEGL